MAKLTVSGLDELADYLERRQMQTSRLAHMMVDNGAAELVKEWKAKITEKGHIESRAMLNAVKAKKTETKDETLEKVVYPMGKDEKGVRNAEKAFLLHYGWKSNAATNGPHDGDHFVDEIEQEAEPKVVAAMEETMNKFLQEGK